MSTFEVTEVKGQKKLKLGDVVFLYCKLQEGNFCYGSKTDKEYTVDVVVDKATSKAFKKMFPKNGVKEIETSEFEAKYKTAPPYPDADEQYVLKLKAKAQMSKDVGDLKAGDMIPYEWASRPKAFFPVEGGVVDKTMEVLVGNGSRGDAALKILTTDFGVSCQLTGILVKDLVEYEGNSGTQSDFGEVVGGYNKGSGETKQKASAGRSQEPEQEAPDFGTDDNEEGFDDDLDAPF